MAALDRCKHPNAEYTGQDSFGDGRPIYYCKDCDTSYLRDIDKNTCTHPNSRYDGEEESFNCKKQKIVRDRWKCPDCRGVWYEGMRVWDDNLQRYVSPL